MKKEKIEIARSLKSNSPNIIWALIGTAEGMARWLADEVTNNGDTLTFTWGNPWSHHETRLANILQCEKRKLIKIRWDNEEDQDAYMQLEMEKGTLTNDYTLHITDFAYPDDVDSLLYVWDKNLERLHANSGL